MKKAKALFQVCGFSLGISTVIERPVDGMKDHEEERYNDGSRDIKGRKSEGSQPHCLSDHFHLKQHGIVVEYIPDPSSSLVHFALMQVRKLASASVLASEFVTLSYFQFPSSSVLVGIYYKYPKAFHEINGNKYHRHVLVVGDESANEKLNKAMPLSCKKATKAIKNKASLIFPLQDNLPLKVHYYVRLTRDMKWYYLDGTQKRQQVNSHKYKSICAFCAFELQIEIEVFGSKHRLRNTVPDNCEAVNEDVIHPEKKMQRCGFNLCLSASCCVKCMKGENKAQEAKNTRGDRKRSYCMTTILPPRVRHEAEYISWSSQWPR
ncbi:hypothetical protein ACTXT7_014107 [Hymenolepis weldensis]